MLGHDTQESTVNLLYELAQLESVNFQVQINSTTDIEIINTGQPLLAAIDRYRASIDNRVTRHDLKTNYLNNVRNYTAKVLILLSKVI